MASKESLELTAIVGSEAHESAVLLTQNKESKGILRKHNRSSWLYIILAVLISLCVIGVFYHRASSPLPTTLTSATASGPKHPHHLESFDWQQVHPNLPLSYADWQDNIYELTLPSGLKWVHINDKNTKLATWSVLVGAGSFNEGKDYPEGTAHLLEHSIFLQMSEEEKVKYNYWNAYTANQKTVYIFATSHTSFEESFSNIAKYLLNFRVDPKCRAETDAVHNE
jgi:hypothetical protein